jgi:hypothetical protein
MHSSSEFELWRAALQPKVRLPKVRLKAAAQSSDASSSLTDGPLGGSALFVPTQSCAHEPRGGRLSIDFARAWLERREAEAMGLERGRREAEPPACLPDATVEMEGEWDDEEEPFQFLVFV